MATLSDTHARTTDELEATKEEVRAELVAVQEEVGELLSRITSLQ